MKSVKCKITPLREKVFSNIMEQTTIKIRDPVRYTVLDLIYTIILSQIKSKIYDQVNESLKKDF